MQLEALINTETGRLLENKPFKSWYKVLLWQQNKNNIKNSINRWIFAHHHEEHSPPH